MSFKEFIRELNGSRVEGELVKTISYSLLTGIITLALLYLLRLRYIENAGAKYGLYLLLVICSYALLATTLRQVRAYKELPCMSGMMVGMTSGMIAGFLPGFYVGATNGIFFGSIFGIVIGIGFGIHNGKCCGIMGIMEGIMAGFMGALMGAMTVLMTINDHLNAMAIVVFIVSTFILIGLNYLIYKDMKESNRQLKESHFLTIALTFILTVVTAWFMIFGPKGGIFAQ